MASFAHRRQVLLFLVAVVLPCSVLVVLGVLVVKQERELGERRLADERRLVTRQIRQELSSRLADICANEATRLERDARSFSYTRYSDPAVVFVARIGNGSLFLPWEQNPAVEDAQRWLGWGDFPQSVAAGERTEFAAGDARGAIAAYERALDAAINPAQRTYAQLLLGRVSLKQGSERSALRYLGAVLESSSDVTDEFGVALWSYAASSLLSIRRSPDAVLARLAAELDSARWYPPSQLYLFRSLVDSAAATASDSAIMAQARQLSLDLRGLIAVTEDAIALERELASLPISLDPTDETQTTWVLWDRADWLVGVASPAQGDASILLAVHAQEVFQSLEAVATIGTATALTLDADPDSDGELLGSAFPGLRAHYATDVQGTGSETWHLRRWFYFVVILLVVSVTLFGAYLLWRDVRRELATAEMRSHFVSSVSHELKTPLTAIRMFAETLRMRSTKPETQAEYLDTIVSESERLSRLLNNVLDFAKIERGSKVYRRAPQALGEIAQASARAMQYPLEQAQFKLRVNVNDGLPPVKVDRDAIEQAILNLLANAMKYSGENKDVGLTIEKVGNEAVITVTDRGVGIAAEEQKRIFDQYYRAETDENRHIPGTGLGLTLVDHIAKAHAGYVTVESELGTGSKFSIHLPLEESNS